MLSRKLIRFGLLLAARFCGAASLFAVNLLIVKHLGLESLATYAVFVSLVSILAIIVSTGYPAIAPIFVAEYSKKKQPQLLKGFTTTALRQGCILFGLLATSTAVTVSMTINILEHELLYMVPAILAAAAATAILGLNGAVFVGMKKQVAGLLPETFVRPVLFLGFAFVFLTTGAVTEINGVLWLLTFSVWLTFGIVLFRDRKLHREFSSVSQESDGHRWRSASLPWMGISLLWDFMIDLVLLMTSLIAGSVEIAVLHICFRYRVLAGFGMRTIHTLLMPEITESAVSKNPEEVHRKILQLNIASFVYSVGVLVVFAALGNWLIGIFSIETGLALPVLLIVSATMVIRSIFGPAPLILAIHSFHKDTLWASLVGVVLMTGFLVTTYGHFGILAAAIGYSTANLFISATLWYTTKRKTGINCSIFSGFLGKNSARRSLDNTRWQSAKSPQ